MDSLQPWQPGEDLQACVKSFTDSGGVEGGHREWKGVCVCRRVFVHAKRQQRLTHQTAWIHPTLNGYHTHPSLSHRHARLPPKVTLSFWPRVPAVTSSSWRVCSTDLIRVRQRRCCFLGGVNQLSRASQHLIPQQEAPFSSLGPSDLPQP